MRTMVIISDHHHAEAKRKAANEGISLSAYIRRLIASDLQQAERGVDPAVIFGLFNGGGSKIARF